MFGQAARQAGVKVEAQAKRIGLRLRARAAILETLSKSAPDPFELGRLGETFVSMGVSYWEVGQRDKAVESWDKALKADPRHFRTLVFKGVVAFEDGFHSRTLAHSRDHPAFDLRLQGSLIFFEVFNQNPQRCRRIHTR